MEEDRLCVTCQYGTRKLYEDPCNNCTMVSYFGFSNWVSKDSSSEEETKKKGEIMYEEVTERLERIAKGTRTKLYLEHDMEREGIMKVIFLDMLHNKSIPLTLDVKRLTNESYTDISKEVLNMRFGCKSFNFIPLNYRNIVEKVIFNDPATIILWKDGTKTVVKSHGEDYDPEKGFAMAVAKKVFGNEGNYYEVFKKWLPKEEETVSSESLEDAFRKLADLATKLDNLNAD